MSASDERLASLDAKIAELTQEREARLQTLAAPWPKRTTIYLHGSKESNYNHGVELGLSEEACEQFMYACYEVGMTLEVTEAGEAIIVAVDGRPVGPQPPAPQKG